VARRWALDDPKRSTQRRQPTAGGHCLALRDKERSAKSKAELTTPETGSYVSRQAFLLCIEEKFRAITAYGSDPEIRLQVMRWHCLGKSIPWLADRLGARGGAPLLLLSSLLGKPVIDRRRGFVGNLSDLARSSLPDIPRRSVAFVVQRGPLEALPSPAVGPMCKTVAGNPRSDSMSHPAPSRLSKVDALRRDLLAVQTLLRQSDRRRCGAQVGAPSTTCTS